MRMFSEKSGHQWQSSVYQYTLVTASDSSASLTISFCNTLPACSPQGHLQGHLQMSSPLSWQRWMTLLCYPAKMFNTGSSLPTIPLIVNILVELDQSKSYLHEGYVNEVQSTSCLVTEIFTQCSEQSLIDYVLNFRTHTHKIHIFSLISRAWQYVVTEIFLWSITRWGTSLVVQWVRFCASYAGGLGSIMELDPTFCN